MGLQRLKPFPKGPRSSPYLGVPVLTPLFQTESYLRLTYPFNRMNLD